MTMPSSRQEEEPAAGSDPPARPGGRFQVSSPALQGLLALAVYLAIWILAETLALVVQPGRPQLDQMSMDPNFYTWSLRWWPYAISHGLNPLHTTEISAPAGAGLAWVTTIPPLAVLALPITATAGPVVAYNLLAAVSLPVSAWAAFVLCRRLTRQFWPALIGGAVYGFSAYQLNHMAAGQLNLTFSLLLPLMAYLLILRHEEKISRPVFVVLLAIVMTAQLLLFLETFADLTAVLVLAFLAAFALAGRSGRPVVLRLGLLVGLAYGLTIAIASPYLVYALTHVPQGFARSPAKSALDLAGLVVPPPDHTLGLSWLARIAARIVGPTRDGYLGIPLLVLAVALAVINWSRKLIRFLLVMLAVVILFALGPTLRVAGHRVIALPWHRLWFLPVARSAYPARFMVFAFLILAMMVALWLAGPSRRRWARWLLALLGVLALVANVSGLNVQNGAGTPAFIATSQYRQYLAPGSTVVVVSGRGNAGLLWQAQTDFYTRLAGGYINAAIAHKTDLPRPVANLAKRPVTRSEAQRFQRFLHRDRISAILVEQSSAGPWPAIFTGLGLQGQVIGGVILYRTNS